MRCKVHDLTSCALCTGRRSIVLANDDDSDFGARPPRAAPIRAWGGAFPVNVLGKDDEPLTIPYALQYTWMAGLHSSVRHDARFSAIAYAWVKHTAERAGVPLPDIETRQDIAQDGLVLLIDWWRNQATDSQKIELRTSIRQVCFFVGKAFRAYRLKNRADRAVQTEPLDESTGTRYGTIERWAVPGTYLPLLGVLREARAAINTGKATGLQTQLVRAWELFDPDFEGRITRDLRANPLDDRERKVLQRARDRQDESDTYSLEVDETIDPSAWF